MPDTKKEEFLECIDMTEENLLEALQWYEEYDNYTEQTCKELYKDFLYKFYSETYNKGVEVDVSHNVEDPLNPDCTHYERSLYIDGEKVSKDEICNEEWFSSLQEYFNYAETNEIHNANREMFVNLLDEVAEIGEWNGKTIFYYYENARVYSNSEDYKCLKGYENFEARGLNMEVVKENMPETMYEEWFGQCKDIEMEM